MPAPPLMTSDQIEDLWCGCSDPGEAEMSIHEFARAVEAEVRKQFAIEAPAVPMGWRLVPDSATHNMLRAANLGRKNGRSSSGDIYAAMLAAAPTAPAVPAATILRGGSDKFGRATVLVRWEDGALALPNGEHKLYAAPIVPAVPAWAPTDHEILMMWDRVSHMTPAGSRRLAFGRALLEATSTAPAVVPPPKMTPEEIHAAYLKPPLGPIEFARKVEAARDEQWRAALGEHS